MPPTTLTRAQFRQRRPKGNYRSYLSYIGQRRRQGSREIDPLAPLTPQALRSQVTQDVTSQTRPLIEHIQKTLGGAASAGAQNIEGVSSRLAESLVGAQGAQAEIYKRARESLGALDTAVAGRLGTAGDALAGDFEKRMAAAGLPTEGAAAITAASKGAVGAGFARGSAETAGLTERQAAAESYAAGLPGLARLAGLQGVAERRAQGQRDIAEQVGSVRAQVPGLVTQSLASGRQREFEKGVARVGLQADIAEMGSRERQNAADNAAAAARARQAEAGRNRRATQAERGRMERAAMSTAVQQANAAETQRKNRAAERGKATAARKPNASLSRAYGYIVDASGRPILDVRGKKIKVAKTSESTGSGSPSGLGP